MGAVADLSVRGDPPGGEKERERGRERERERGRKRDRERERERKRDGERERKREGEKERERERERKRIPQKIKRKKKDIVLCPANVFILENYRNRGRREHSWKYIYI
jgi:hypothetical protein